MAEVKGPNGGVTVDGIDYIPCALKTDFTVRDIQLSDLVRVDQVRRQNAANLLAKLAASKVKAHELPLACELFRNVHHILLIVDRSHDVQKMDLVLVELHKG